MKLFIGLFLILAITVDAKAITPVQAGIYADISGGLYTVNTNNNTIVIVALDMVEWDFQPSIGYQNEDVFMVRTIQGDVDATYRLTVLDPWTVFVTQMSCIPRYAYIKCRISNGTSYTVSKIF